MSLVASGAMSQVHQLVELLEEIAVPLVSIDEATLHLVTATPARVHIHLGGAYAGCPGNGFVERSLLAPLVKRALPSATLEVTSGLPIPAGAQRLGPPPATDGARAADDARGRAEDGDDGAEESADEPRRLRVGGRG
ncbi:MAG: hypothetical protein KIS78_06000 [Labilithrix sp.]|nr:hypothetical protein [Labilithrix sp.]